MEACGAAAALTGGGGEGAEAIAAPAAPAAPAPTPIAPAEVSRDNEHLTLVPSVGGNVLD
eukprot:SAG31_NODE_18762_length_623_cov_1.721374_1_plen_60_part_00